MLWDVEPGGPVEQPPPPGSAAMRATTALIWGYGEGVDALDFWVANEGAERYWSTAHR